MVSGFQRLSCTFENKEIDEYLKSLLGEEDRARIGKDKFYPIKLDVQPNGDINATFIVATVVEEANGT